MTKWIIKSGWRLALVIGVSLMGGLAVACGDDDDNASNTPTKAASGSASAAATTAPAGAGDALKIGGLLSFTGDLGSYGQPIFNGIELAVAEINSKGGVNGKPIELVKGDDATSPQQAVTEAQRLVNVEHVDAIVGTLPSTASLQVAETVTGPAHVVQISPASTSPSLTDAKDNDYLFRTTISDAAQGIVMANLAKDANYDKICTMYVNNAYGKGLATAFKNAFQALGGTVTAEVPHEENQPTYATELGQCGDAETLASPAYPASATTFLREAKEGNLFKNYLFTDGTKDPDMFTNLGYANFDGFRGTSPAALPTASATTFANAYKAKYGELPPKPYIREAYDATYLIALAAQKAGSNTGEAIHDQLRDVTNAPGETAQPGPDGWAAAVAKIAAGSEIDYEGTNSLEFDDKGDPLVGAIQWWHVDAAQSTLVTDKTFQVDLTTKEVTDISSQVTQ
jgi:branched-chain amino acid transport system substrate-binding protein